MPRATDLGRGPYLVRVIYTRGEHTICLLSGHVVNLPLKYCVSTHVQMPFLRLDQRRN